MYLSLPVWAAARVQCGPVIAKAARDAGILTVGIVTMPYVFEGPSRVKNAMAGIEESQKERRFAAYN